MLRLMGGEHLDMMQCFAFHSPVNIENSENSVRVGLFIHFCL